MNARTLTIQILAGLALLALGFGFGVGMRVGIGRGERDREAGVPAVSGAMKPVLPSGASPVAERAARGEIREFVPGRPFAKGEAEAWLLGIRGKGLASMRALATLDADAAKEVLETLLAIQERLKMGDGDTVELWKDHADLQSMQSEWVIPLSILAAQDPESAVALINELGETFWRTEKEFAEMVFAEIARHGSGRLETLLAAVVPELLPSAVEGSIRELLQSDVEAGIALMMKYPGEEFKYVRRDGVSSLMNSDPRRALAVASTLVGDGQESEPLFHAIDEWLEKDEAAARQWVEEHEGPGRDHARARLLGHDAARDTGAAVAGFAALRNEGVPNEALEGAIQAIVEGMGETDPGAARTWLDTLPAGSLHDEAVSELAETWVEQDPEAASEWIATFPPGEQRDAGAQHLVRAIRKRDPPAALEWARNVGDDDTRRTMIAEVLGEWHGQDPESAEAAALGLPEEDRPQEIAIPIDSLEFLD